MRETPIFLRIVLILTWNVNRNVEISEKLYTVLPVSLLYIKVDRRPKLW